jgi:hypothetical protein
MIHFNQILITPTTARGMLELNTSNRRIKQPIVDMYAKDMAAGRWKENTGEVIKISQTNKILDGQHRLEAIVKSNVAILMHIAVGLEDSVFDVLDTGSSRNATDTFMVAGIKNENMIPSIISMYNLLDTNKRFGAQKNNKSTNSLLLNQYFSNEDYWQNLAKQSKIWYLAFAKILPPSFIGGFYAFFSKLNEDKADQFISELCTGLGSNNFVINLLRNKLMQDKMSPRKMPPSLKIALIIKAWNYYVTNKSVKFLKFDTVNEEYPKAIKL